MNFSKRYAITFGEVAILHVGLSELGQKAAEGYSVEELSEIANKLEEKDIEVELINLTDKLPKKYSNGNDASVLIIRNGVNHLLKKEDASDKLYLEQDKKVIYEPVKLEQNYRNIDF